MKRILRLKASGLTFRESPLLAGNILCACKDRCDCAFLTPLPFLDKKSVPSPVVHAPGTGQVGEGLQNAWGLDEVEEEEEEEDIEQGGPEKQPESETITSKKGKC